EATDAPADIIAEKAPTHYQYKGRLIMTAVKSGLMIIDQHRAHLRVLFEEYVDKMKHHKWNTQSVLFPELITCSLEEANVMRQIMPELADMGFSISDLGGDSFSIVGVPAGFEGMDATAMLHGIIADAREKVGHPKDELNNVMALSLANAAAIPQGQVLGNEEMENLVNRLFCCSNVNTTPDGKPILAILKQGEIDRLLGL
ncbi:MAG: DNA mismatch repair protein MutL, partial [Prevotella sp.]|nr:DNA mismatch repair protein MutL [Prevotella sp.]